jgi:predicted transcriptional regulator of viral defense system
MKDAREVIGESAKEAIRGLTRKKWVLRLKRDLFTIVPLDMGTKGADTFVFHEYVVASLLAKEYYVGFWSALNYHGLTDQVPRTTYVAVTEPRHAVQILDSPFLFVKLTRTKFLGWQEYDVGTSKVRISNPEKTIADCLDHPEHCGGIEQIARAVYFYNSEFSLPTVVDFAKMMKNRTILKRLGYLLEELGLPEEYMDCLADFVPSQGYPRLDLLSPSIGKYNERWKLLINYRLRPEAWVY